MPHFVVAADIEISLLGPNEKWPDWQFLYDGDISKRPDHPWLSVDSGAAEKLELAASADESNGDDAVQHSPTLKSVPDDESREGQGPEDESSKGDKGKGKEKETAGDKKLVDNPRPISHHSSPDHRLSNVDRKGKGKASEPTTIETSRHFGPLGRQRIIPLTTNPPTSDHNAEKRPSQATDDPTPAAPKERDTIAEDEEEDDDSKPRGRSRQRSVKARARSQSRSRNQRSTSAPDSRVVGEGETLAEEPCGRCKKSNYVCIVGRNTACKMCNTSKVKCTFCRKPPPPSQKKTIETKATDDQRAGRRKTAKAVQETSKAVKEVATRKRRQESPPAPSPSTVESTEPVEDIAERPAKRHRQRLLPVQAEPAPSTSSAAIIHRDHRIGQPARPGRQPSSKSLT